MKWTGHSNISKTMFCKTHYNKSLKSKRKRKFLTAAKGKKKFLSNKGIPIRLWVDLSAATTKTRRECEDTFRVLKKKKKNTLPGKVVLQKFSQQTKPEGVYHHLSGLIRNAERSFSSWNKRTLLVTWIKNIWKYITYWKWLSV